MAFSGWAEEALDFYEGLEADNTKTYWTRQKAVYDEQVLRPMMELLDELGPEFGESKIFRPYRDVRFSKDKAPYKTNIAATIGEGYVSFSAGGLGAGSGMYHLAADQRVTNTPGHLDPQEGRVLALALERLALHAPMLRGIECAHIGRHSRGQRAGGNAKHPRGRPGDPIQRRFEIDPVLICPFERQRQKELEAGRAGLGFGEWKLLRVVVDRRAGDRPQGRPGTAYSRAADSR